jgi:hypothetical protein
MRKTLLIPLGLALFPLLSSAQTAPPRFYLSAGGALLTPRPFSSYDQTLGGPMLTAGAWLGTRLALQVGGTVTWATNDYRSYTSHPVPPVGTVSNKLTVYTFPVLLRGALRPAAKQFAIDGLAGYTLLHSKTTYTRQAGDELASTTNKSNLTLGPSFRYTTPLHLGVEITPLLNFNLSDTKYISFQQSFFWNLMGGIYYSFG